MEIGLLVCVCILCFLIRLVPRIILKDAIVSDTYFHFYCANLISKDRFRIPNKLPGVILGHNYTYPFGYHLFLALFPLPQRLWVERATGAVFDTINTVIVFVTSKWLLTINGTNSLWIPLICAFLYSLSPALLRIGSGPRAFNGSARVPGQTLYLLHIISAYHCFVTNDVITLIISIAAGAVLIFTAIFSTQVLFFLTLPFAVIVSPKYLVLISITLITSVILSKGVTWRILTGTVAHLKLYYSDLQQIFLYPHIIIWRKYAENSHHAFKMLANGNWKTFRHWFFHERYFIHLLLTVFPVFLIFPFAITLDSIRTASITPYLLTWLLACLALFFLTKSKKLLFLGEGERYLEAAIFPATFLFVLISIDHLWPLVALFALYSIYSATYYIKDYLDSFTVLNKDYSDSEPLFSILRLLPTGSILPIGWVHWQALHRTDFPVLTYGGNVDTKLLSAEEFLFVYGNYPYPGTDFEKIVSTYGIEYILAERSCYNHYLAHILPSPSIFLDSTILLSESSTLLLFKHKNGLKEKCQQFNDLIADNKLEGAKTTLDELLLFMPKNPVFNSTKGIVELNLGNYEEAIKSFENLVALDPTQIVAYIGMAQASIKMNRLDDADKYAMIAAQHDPFNRDVLNMLNDITHRKLASKGDDMTQLDVVYCDFSKKCKSSPDNIASAWAELADALFRMKRIEESSHAMYKALEIDPHHNGALLVKQMLADLRPEMPNRPHILLIADVPNWIFARHCAVLSKLLSDEFDFDLKLMGQPYEEDDYDLIYPMEFILIPFDRIKTPAKYVTGIRSHISWSGYDFLLFAETLATKYQRVHCVSQRLTDIFRPFVPNLHYVTHGTDTSFFTPTTRVDQGPPGRIRIGWAGNRERNKIKGFEDFVAPLGNLPGVELIYCGYQDKNLDLEEMRRFYDSIDCYVCTSSIEGNNNSLMEAAAMERAIITTDNGTVPEFLRQGESAIIVERELPNFIHAVCVLRDNPVKRGELGRQARIAVKRTFEWSDMAPKYAEFFRQALNHVESWSPPHGIVSKMVMPQSTSINSDPQVTIPIETSERNIEIAKSQPLSRDQYIGLAMQYHQAGQLEQAEIIYRQILSDNINDFAAIHMLGVVCYQRGDLVQAEQLLQRALALNNLMPEVHYNLGNVYVLQRRIIEAHDCFAQALVLNKDFTLASQQLMALNKVH